MERKERALGGEWLPWTVLQALVGPREALTEETEVPPGPHEPSEQAVRQAELFAQTGPAQLRPGVVLLDDVLGSEIERLKGAGAIPKSHAESDASRQMNLLECLTDRLAADST